MLSTSAEIRRRWRLLENDGGLPISVRRAYLRKALHAVIIFANELDGAVKILRDCPLPPCRRRGRCRAGTCARGVLGRLGSVWAAEVGGGGGCVEEVLDGEGGGAQRDRVGAERAQLDGRVGVRLGEGPAAGGIADPGEYPLA